MLIGNFCAICSSALFAIYSVHSTQMLRDAAQCPTYIYLAMLSCFMMGFSYIFSFCDGTPVQIVSINPVNGLFGLFMTKYVIRFKNVEIMLCMESAVSE